MLHPHPFLPLGKGEGHFAALDASSVLKYQKRGWDSWKFGSTQKSLISSFIVLDSFSFCSSPKEEEEEEPIYFSFFFFLKGEILISSESMKSVPPTLLSTRLSGCCYPSP